MVLSNPGQCGLLVNHEPALEIGMFSVIRITSCPFWLGLCLVCGMIPGVVQAQNKLLNDPAGLFREFDKNKDGRLSADEIPAQHRALAKSFDFNNDNQLDAREYLQLALKARANAKGAQAPAKKPAANDDAIPPDTRVLKDVAYVPDGHERQKLDLYLPPTGTAPRPVVIWIHGGGWRAGDKAENRAQSLLKSGFAVASVNYRYTTHAPFPAQFEDCQAAVRFLREQAKDYELDPERFGAWGSSAGGHLTALLATYDGDQPRSANKTSARVQAAVDWFGPTDFVSMGEYSVQALLLSAKRKDPNLGEQAKYLGETFQLCFGGPPSPRTKQLMHDSSPVNFASKDDPPILIMHGDRDTLVPLSQSQVLHNALSKVGVDSTLKVIRGAGHGFTAQDVNPAVEQFFIKHLKP